MKIFVYADCSNLYYCGKSKYGSKLSYSKLVDYLEGLGSVEKKVAYISMKDREAQGFVDALENRGWECRIKSPKVYEKPDGGIRRKADWDVGMAVDIITDAELEMSDGDMVVLLSADGDMTPVISSHIIVDRKIRVGIMGFEISNELSQAAEWSVEIPPSMMEGA